jgi:methionyl-tRNA synthetase
MSKRFYVTTPLYYVNATPHIGHAYTTLAADILVRYKRLRGREAYLLTGTDEHGANIEKVAKAAGRSPEAWADGVAQQFRALWKDLDIVFDDFIRTTEPRHTVPVQHVFEKLLKQGDIYPGTYEGWYCLPCENFYDLSELVDGNCPVHGKPVEKVREDTYFFKLSRFEKPLLEHYERHPQFLLPAWRASEIINFVKSGLKDLSVTRTRVAWGVPVSSAPGHTVYVWFDALLNYITAAGYDPEAPKPLFDELWPADIQLVGKEIFRFHAVIWPAMLMALGLPLPESVFAHGWWTVEGEKMSKSRGNFIDPRAVGAEFGVDALRYFLFREVPFGGDGDFSLASLKARYNADLANNLGNLLSRVLQMAEKYQGGDIPEPKAVEARPFFSQTLKGETRDRYQKAMDDLDFYSALGFVWEAVAALNRQVDQEQPWVKAKSDPETLKFLLFDWVWSLRHIADFVAPFMPETAQKMKGQLGWNGQGWDKVRKGPSLFPRK